MIDSNNENVFALYFHSKRSKIKSLFTFHLSLPADYVTANWVYVFLGGLDMIALTCSYLQWMTFIDKLLSLKYRCEMPILRSPELYWRGLFC